MCSNGCYGAEGLGEASGFSLRYSWRFVLVLPEGASLYDSGLYWCTVVTRGRRAIFAAWSRELLLNIALGRYAWERAAQIAPGKGRWWRGR